MFEDGFGDEKREFIECKCCGSEAVAPVEYLEMDDMETGIGEESVFYTCFVCGDNWTSSKVTEEDAEIVFVHQIDWFPLLRREIQLPSVTLVNDVDDEDWDYYLGSKNIEQKKWFNVLKRRRDEIKASLVN